MLPIMKKLKKPLLLPPLIVNHHLINLSHFIHYCSVLNNRPLLIIIGGEFQAIETQYSAEQYLCSISKLIKSGIKDAKPKFEQSRTETVDFRRN